MREMGPAIVGACRLVSSKPCSRRCCVRYLDALTQKAGELETSSPPDEALVSWFREGVAFVHSYSGVFALMASAHADPDSALYASCTAVHEAGARLLLRAQAEGTARADIDGTTCSP